LVLYNIFGSRKIKNQDKQNTFSLFVLSLFLKNITTIKIIIPKPIRVFKKEKYEISEMSKSKTGLAKESGIIGRFDMSGTNPYLFISEEFLKATERSQSQVIPETAYSKKVRKYIFLFR
jgi:hypothetical protein